MAMSGLRTSIHGPRDSTFPTTRLLPSNQRRNLTKKDAVPPKEIDQSCEAEGLDPAYSKDRQKVSRKYIKLDRDTFRSASNDTVSPLLDISSNTSTVSPSLYTPKDFASVHNNVQTASTYAQAELAIPIDPQLLSSVDSLTNILLDPNASEEPAFGPDLIFNPHQLEVCTVSWFFRRKTIGRNCQWR